MNVDDAPIPVAPIDIPLIDPMFALDDAALGAAFCSVGGCWAEVRAAARIGRHGHTAAVAHAGREESSAIAGTANATAASIAAALNRRIARSTFRVYLESRAPPQDVRNMKPTRQPATESAALQV
jgi:hypothetical protein